VHDGHKNFWRKKKETSGRQMQLNFPVKGRLYVGIELGMTALKMTKSEKISQAPLCAAATPKLLQLKNFY